MSNVETKEVPGRHFTGMVSFGTPWLVAWLVPLAIWVAVAILADGAQVPEWWNAIPVWSALLFAAGLAWWYWQPVRCRGINRDTGATPEEKRLAREISRNWQKLAVYGCPRLTDSMGDERYPGLHGLWLKERPEGRFLAVVAREPQHVRIPASFWDDFATMLEQKFAGWLVPSISPIVEQTQKGARVLLPVASTPSGIERL